ncbi:DUF6082 family protein [Streptomyces sp. NPDC102394]|uniref:DUF6082 family protein n=1 Tax=Streptomyces sp. NPDC102394 TaxID=3366167 RepID=UPI0037F18320
MGTKISAAGTLLPAAAGLGFAAGALMMLAACRRTLDAFEARLKSLEQSPNTRRQANIAHQHRLHWELLSKAMDNADLAEVLDAYDGSLSIKRQRQFLYANALYTNMVFNYRLGNLSREQFYGSVRGMLQNPICREYWHATQPYRATLDNASEEAQLGALVDELLRQLEDAEIDEWWVVGDPPPEV